MKDLFAKYDTINYPLDGMSKKITNISTSFHLVRLTTNKAFTFDEYRLEAGETPESVAEKVYHDKSYFWVILLINGIVNPYNDWYQSFDVIEDRCKIKYANGLEGIHHYYNTSKDRVCDPYEEGIYRSAPNNLPFFIRPVTNYEHEVERNEKRRTIALIRVDSLRKFIEDYELMLTGRYRPANAI